MPETQLARARAASPVAQRTRGAQPTILRSRNDTGEAAACRKACSVHAPVCPSSRIPALPPARRRRSRPMWRAALPAARVAADRPRLEHGARIVVGAEPRLSVSVMSPEEMRHLFETHRDAEAIRDYDAILAIRGTSRPFPIWLRTTRVGPSETTSSSCGARSGARAAGPGSACHRRDAPSWSRLRMSRRSAMG